MIERYHSIKKDIAALEGEMKQSESIFERLETEGQVGVDLYRNWTILARETSPGSLSSLNSSQLNASMQDTRIFTENQAIVF